MKRLERHQKNILTRNLFLIATVFVLLIIFIFTVGIKTLLESAAFISQLTKKNQPEDLSTKKNDFIGNIDITNIPTATNSSQIIVSGKILNYDSVVVYLDDEKVDQMDVQDTFDLKIDNLKDGDNKIYFLAKSKKNKLIEKTSVYNVFVKKEKPKLEIIEPTNNTKTAKEEIKLVGKTDKEVMIDVNDLPLVVNALGDFETFVKLHLGENKINITAQDIAGNFESKTVTVVYEKD